MPYIFDGIEYNNVTSKDMSLNPADLGNRQRAQEIIYKNDVLESSTDYDEHTDIYRPYQRKMIFHKLDNEKMPLIYSWLKGYGILRTARDKGGFFMANVTSALEINGLIPEKIEVDFKINPPFFYLDKGQIPITFTANPTESIFNPGTYKSEPIIKIYGSGNIVFKCNDKIINITGLVSEITLNSELKKAYMDLSDLENKVLGSYPIFEVGHNFISWTGNVIKIVIVPNWREL